MSVSALHNVDDVYPLTATQEGMLYHTLVQPGSGVYVVQYSCVFDGSLNAAKYRKAWETVVASHGVLRTCFVWDGLDEPQQVIRSHVELPWRVLDWRSLGENARTEEFERVTRNESEAGFDVGHAPLMRFLLLRETDSRTRFVWSFHHMLLDGWSRAKIFGQVLDEYVALLQGRVSAPLAKPQFRDYVSWLQNCDVDEARAYWTNYLKDARPTSFPRSGRSVSGEPYAQDVFTFPATLVDRLKAFGRQQRVTLSTILNGCCAIVVGRYAGVEEPVLGTTALGRPAELDQSDEIAGMLMSTFPVKVELAPDRPTGAWLQDLQKRLAESRQFEFASVSNIQRWTGRPGRPLFDTLVSLNNFPADYRRNTVSIVDERYVDRSNYPLALVFTLESELKLYAVYDRRTFDTWFVQNLCQSILAVATSFADGAVTLRRVRSLSVAQAHSLERIESTGEHEWLDVPLEERIRERAEDYPDRLAVISESGSGITYGELERISGGLAAHLAERASGDARVALLMDASPIAIAAMLACLRSGLAYVPIDPQYPSERISQIVRDANPAVILTTKEYIDLVRSNDRALLIEDLDLSRRSWHGGEAGGESDPAYVIYTSGSSGGPKGVVVSRANLRNSTLARLTHYEQPVERFLLLSSTSFDSSVAGIYWTLVSGGTLVMTELSIVQDLERLSCLIERHEITHTLCLPSVYHSLLQFTDVRRLRSLKTVVVAGEVCSGAVARLHFEKLPACRLSNEYGPTEATVWSTVHRVRPEDANGGVPIGRPIQNTKVYLLDSDLARVPPGAVGEIYLGGQNLAVEYLGRADATHSAFVCAPSLGSERLYRTGDLGRYREDGSIDFLGRKDRQIKIRGYRIEIDEVESVIRGCRGVREAVVDTNHSNEEQNLDTLEQRMLRLDSNTVDSLLSRLELA